MKSIYIHIPFCERICTYCDFPKRVGTVKQMDEYLSALKKEVDLYEVNEPIDTLYIGGGTPSILNPDQLEYLNNIIKQFSFNSKYEFTIECNPEHITKELVEIYKSMGVNRISLGVQTFNDRLLKLLNRGHNKANVYHAIDIINKTGIINISVDMMFALPTQNIEMLKEDLNEINQLNINHISYYSLILEEKTVLSKLVREQKLNLIENEVEAQMYELVLNELKKLGYVHYEISNFSREGFQSIHNQVYWNNQEYYGFGMGASGYLNGVRYSNEHLVSTYINKLKENVKPIKFKEKLTQKDIRNEMMMLGLRLIDGINISYVNDIYQMDIKSYFKEELDYLSENGLITVNENIKLTHKGLFYGNEVFCLFV